MNFTTIAVQMIELFLIMGIGYICRKADYIDEHAAVKMNVFLLNVTTPCLVISSVGDEVPYSMGEVFFVLFIALMMYLIMPFVAWVINKILRVEKENFGIYMFMTIFSNLGFMGYPVVRTIFGESAVFLCSIFNMMFGLFAYSMGVIIFNMDLEKKETESLLRQVMNPAMAGSAIAMIIFLLGIRLPSVLVDTLSLVGQITTPLAMILIGVSLASLPVSEIFSEVRLYPYALIKQIAVPVAALYILRPLISDPLILGLTVIMIAMPVANTTNIFANRYGGNVALAAKGIFITTLCSFVTIPVICLFL